MGEPGPGSSERFADGTTRRIWAGLGDTMESQMGRCVKSRQVSFRWIDAKKLEKTITEETRWQAQPIDEEWAKALKRNCKLKKKATRVERVALP